MTKDRTTAPSHVALAAHDNQKDNLLDWARYNRDVLAAHELVATGTIGQLLQQQPGLEVTCLRSGPLGSDLQLGALVREGEIELMVFFWDPLEPQPHDPDVKALLRIAIVWNTPIACNRATADHLISSPLLHQAYERQIPTYGGPTATGGRQAAA